MELAADRRAGNTHTAGQAAGWGGSGGSAGLGGRNAQVGGAPWEAPPCEGREDPRAQQQAGGGRTGRQDGSGGTQAAGWQWGAGLGE